jgi:hypothetical protein
MEQKNKEILSNRWLAAIIIGKLTDCIVSLEKKKNIIFSIIPRKYKSKQIDCGDITSNKDIHHHFWLVFNSPGVDKDRSFICKTKNSLVRWMTVRSFLSFDTFVQRNHTSFLYPSKNFFSLSRFNFMITTA